MIHGLMLYGLVIHGLLVRTFRIHYVRFICFKLLNLSGGFSSQRAFYGEEKTAARFRETVKVFNRTVTNV